MPFRLFSSERRRRERVARDLYLAAVARARQPMFYAELGVPDSVDGRFDLIVLHSFLLMRRLGGIKGAMAAAAKDLSQALFDLMFADMDQQLREMGVTDLAVGRKVRQMAEAFYGRVAAYETAMADGQAALAEALARNLHRSVERPDPAHADALAAYLLSQDAHLATCDEAALLEGKVSFR